MMLRDLEYAGMVGAMCGPIIGRNARESENPAAVKGLNDLFRPGVSSKVACVSSSNETLSHYRRAS